MIMTIGPLFLFILGTSAYAEISNYTPDPDPPTFAPMRGIDWVVLSIAGVIALSVIVIVGRVIVFAVFTRGRPGFEINCSGKIISSHKHVHDLVKTNNTNNAKIEWVADLDYYYYKIRIGDEFTALLDDYNKNRRCSWIPIEDPRWLDPSTDILIFKMTEETFSATNIEVDQPIRVRLKPHILEDANEMWDFNVISAITIHGKVIRAL